MKSEVLWTFIAQLWRIFMWCVFNVLFRQFWKWLCSSDFVFIQEWCYPTCLAGLRELCHCVLCKCCLLYVSFNCIQSVSVCLSALLANKRVHKQWCNNKPSDARLIWQCATAMRTILKSNATFFIDKLPPTVYTWKPTQMTNKNYSKSLIRLETISSFWEIIDSHKR